MGNPYAGQSSNSYERTNYNPSSGIGVSKLNYGYVP